MRTEHSGTGDPERTLALLWGVAEPSRRGPKARHSVAEIVAAATTIADAEGLGALSMRRIATDLGIGTMSVYTYVPSKAELLDLMLDAAYAETAKPRDVPGSWRDRLTQVARENWALYHRHPWMLEVATTRPVLGPNLLAKYEHELRAVEGIGLSDVDMDSVVDLVAGFVESAARRSVAATEVRRDTGMTDEQWWEVHAPVLQRVGQLADYPLAVRVGSAAGAAHGGAAAPAYGFEFGLARVLDGIEVLLGEPAGRAE